MTSRWIGRFVANVEAEAPPSMVQKKLLLEKRKGKNFMRSTSPKVMAIEKPKPKIEPAWGFKTRSKSWAPRSSEASKKRTLVL